MNPVQVAANFGYVPQLFGGTFPRLFPGIDRLALVLPELVCFKDVRMAGLFKNLKLALDVLELTFDYRFFLKPGLDFTPLSANREIV